MAELGLLCLLVTSIAWQCWLATRVRRLWRLAFLATKREQAPQKWESRLAELQADVVSLSSSYEKVATLVTRQNSRSVMRERRSAASDQAPPPGSSKAEIRKYYGLNTSGPEFAKRQLALVPNKE